MTSFTSTKLVIALFFSSIVLPLSAQSLSFSYSADPQTGILRECTVVNLKMTVTNSTGSNKFVDIDLRFQIPTIRIENQGDYPTFVNIDPNFNALKTTNQFIMSGSSRVFNCQIMINALPSNASDVLLKALVNETGQPQGLTSVQIFFGGNVADGRISPVNLSSLSGVKQELVVLGTLNIDEDLYLSGSIDYIRMGNDAKINIKSGKTLSLSYTSVEGCQSRWNSITAESGSYLDAYGTTIKDGNKAFSANDGSNLSVGRCSFIDNYISIHVPYSNNLQTINGFVGGSTFTGTGQLKQFGTSTLEYALPYAGIHVNRATGLSIGANNSWFKNNFNNLSTGILSEYGSNLMVRGSIFSNLSSSVYGSGIGIITTGYNNMLDLEGLGKYNNPTFDNCYIGISAVQSSSLKISENNMTNIELMGINNFYNTSGAYVRIKENYMWGIKKGIRTRYSYIGDGEISDNTILAHANDGDIHNAHALDCGENYSSGAWVIKQNDFYTDNAVSALRFNSGSNPTIKENAFQQLGSLAVFNGSYISGTYQPNMSCNWVSGNGPNGFNGSRGMYIYGASYGNISCNDISYVSQPFDFTGMCDATQLKANSMGYSLYGLNINYSSYIGTQLHRGNLFNGPFSSGCGANHGSTDQFDREQSKFTAHQSSGTYWPFSNGSCINNGLFEYNPNGSPFSCSSSNTCPNGVGPMLRQPNNETTSEDEVMDKLDETLITGKLPESDYSKELQWTGRRHLYRRLNDNPTLKSKDRRYSEYLSNQVGTSIAEFEDFERQFSDLIKTEASKTVMIKYNNEKISKIMTELSAFDTKLTEVDFKDVKAKKTLMDERRAYCDKMKTLGLQSEKVHASVSIWKKAELEKLASKNKRISAFNMLEDNQKQVNQIKIETTLADATTLTASQIETLERIAGQCPLSGGDAVFEARSLLSISKEVYYDDEKLCKNQNQLVENVPISKTVRPLSNSGLSISPNPAYNVLSVSFEGKIDDKGQMMIVNSLGKALKVNNVNANQVYSIDVSDIPNGLYTLLIKIEGAATKTTQVSIIK
jgi:Secretion system C-terminal sorting domain